MFLSPLCSKNAMLCLAEAEWRLRSYQSLSSVPQYHLHRFSCLSNALPRIVLIQLLCAQTHLSKHSWHLALELMIFGKGCVSHRGKREWVFRNSFTVLFCIAGSLCSGSWLQKGQFLIVTMFSDESVVGKMKARDVLVISKDHPWVRSIKLKDLQSSHLKVLCIFLGERKDSALL